MSQWHRANPDLCGTADDPWTSVESYRRALRVNDGDIGVRIEVAKRPCKNCRAELDISLSYCPLCGYGIRGDAA